MASAVVGATVRDVTIVIATFGDAKWREKASAARIASAAAQGDVEIVLAHDETLARARNTGAEAATGGWLVFLDADDELAPGYVEAMLAATGDLRAPAIQYVYPDGWAQAPLVLADRDIDRINPCCIGTMLRREMFYDAGGFWEEPAWEDWSLFRRCWLLGATIEHVPDAVYRAYVNPASRNHTVHDPKALWRAIRASHDRWLADRIGK
jgi:glycosyltransferase involved in cell wall biosynthesis